MLSNHTKPPRYVQWLDGTDGLPDRSLVGGKAWSLARMTSLGLRVPPAFVVTTEGFREYERTGRISTTLRAELLDGVARIEEQTGRTFAAHPKPLLLSVRSGAAISMPGMMDTVLNLGMTDDVEAALASESGDKRFARDTHKRFQELFIEIVLGLDPRDHEPDGAPGDIRASTLSAIPDLSWQPEDQLFAAVEAVFRSWNSRRARKYRAHHGISDDLGTAVTVQAMVFGNLDTRSCTGVLFSRNPLSGSSEVYGEYLRCAQGEDVVSGRVTPEPLGNLALHNPHLHTEVLSAAKTLENANREVQDIEFTVQEGVLYLLQSRTAKLSAEATLRTSVEMASEGIVTRHEAIARLTSAQAQALVAPRLRTPADGITPTARGESVCAGVGIGRVVTDSDQAVRLAEEGVAVVLARPTTSPEDLPGMLVARAVLTEVGGGTSHAAVVSRALGLPCVVGCGKGSLAKLTNHDVTVDGRSGAVYEGSLPVDVPSEDDSPNIGIVIEWCKAEVPFDVTATSENVDPETVLNLDLAAGGADPDTVGEVIRGRAPHLQTITGGAVTAPDAIAAALETGVSRVVASPVLPVLLSAASKLVNRSAS